MCLSMSNCNAISPYSTMKVPKDMSAHRAEYVEDDLPERNVVVVLNWVANDDEPQQRPEGLHVKGTAMLLQIE